MSTNARCAKCRDAHEGINGRYCNILKIYVEYAEKPKCNRQNKENYPVNQTGWENRERLMSNP